MKKKLLAMFLVLTFVFSVTTSFSGLAEYASNAEGNTVSCLIEILSNSADLADGFEFFNLENDPRVRNADILHFDTVEEAIEYLNMIALLFSEDLVFEFDFDFEEPNSTYSLIAPFSSFSRQGSASAPAAFATRFVIAFTYTLHNRNGDWDHQRYFITNRNPQPVITDFTITNSTFSGVQFGMSWDHMSGGNSVMTHSLAHSTDFRFAVDGVLRQGIGIGGNALGVSRDETITGGLHAIHPSGIGPVTNWPNG